jgi:hypothetical protein
LINAIFKTRDVFIPETEEEDEKNTKSSSHLAIMKKGSPYSGSPTV